MAFGAKENAITLILALCQILFKRFLQNTIYSAVIANVAKVAVFSSLNRCRAVIWLLTFFIYPNASGLFLALRWSGELFKIKLRGNVRADHRFFGHGVYGLRASTIRSR